MTDDEELRPMASRRASWPAFAIAGSALFAGFFGSIESLFTNLTTIFSLHLNYTYDKADEEKADQPIIRTE